jgi:hypothetical protein
VETILQTAKIIQNAATTLLEKATPKLEEVITMVIGRRLGVTRVQAYLVFKQPVVQDFLRRSTGCLLYGVWFYHKKGRSLDKKRSPFWDLELFLSLHPPGNGFPVLKTPPQLSWDDVRDATNALGRDLERRTYHALEREGLSYGLKDTMQASGSTPEAENPPRSPDRPEKSANPDKENQNEGFEVNHQA